MNTVMQFVAKRAGFDLPPDAADKIIEDSGGNLRKAILVLEALKMQSYEFQFHFYCVLSIDNHFLDQI